jgi:hypothetical protein
MKGEEEKMPEINNRQSTRTRLAYLIESTACTRTFTIMNACFFSITLSLSITRFLLRRLLVQPVMVVFCVKTLESRSRRE